MMNWDGGAKRRRRCRALSDRLFPECHVPQDDLQRGKGWGCITEKGLLLKSGPAIPLVWGPCTCVCPQLSRSPCTPRRSTIWICIHTWWFAWPWWCRSPARSTWPHSRPCRAMSYCKHAQLCPRNLQERTKGLADKCSNWNILYRE